MANSGTPSDLDQAMALHSAGRLAEARLIYARVIEDNIDNFTALYMWGVLEVQARENLARAVNLLVRAAALEPANAEAHSNLGIAYREMGRFAEALQFFDHAAALEPDNADIQFNRANALWSMRHSNDAFLGYVRVLALRPAYGEAHYGLGNIHFERGDHAAALASYEAAAAAHAKLDDLAGMILHCRMLLADWREFDEQLGHIARGIERGLRACPPFALLALSDSPALQFKAAQTWAAGFPTAEAPAPPPAEKIRIGYFSMDFRNHPVAQLTVDLFQAHDRSRFDVAAFSYGPNTQDEMRKRLEGAFDIFFDVEGLPDAEIVRLARERRLDIAVDLSGYTSGARPEILVQRAAPVQVSYLGYPGSMGAAHIDYILADRVVAPLESLAYFSEKVVTLPASYYPNSRRIASGAAVTRAAHGLPENAFVFCCFNNTYKITPATFDGWMRILGAVEGSVLWLAEGNAIASANLRREAASRGVNPARLIIAPRMARADHLERHRLADLFLDSLPYNAHTTAGDALWMGLPVLTRIGAAFAARVCASELSALGLPELITDTQADFEARAIALARDPTQLTVLRAKLAHNRSRAPLFDVLTLTRQIEAAYTAMVERHRAGLQPAALFIS